MFCWTEGQVVAGETRRLVTMLTQEHSCNTKCLQHYYYYSIQHIQNDMQAAASTRHLLATLKKTKTKKTPGMLPAFVPPGYRAASQMSRRRLYITLLMIAPRATSHQPVSHSANQHFFWPFPVITRTHPRLIILAC